MKPVHVIIFFAGLMSFPLAKVAFKAPEATGNTDTRRPAETQPSKNIIKMKVTAYCPCKKCCGPKACGLTKTGKDAYRTRGVAASPKLLPYKTRLNVPGIGILTVDDTGGAMRQDAEKGIYHIDVRFPSFGKTEEALKKAHQEALNFGVQWLDVEVL